MRRLDTRDAAFEAEFRALLAAPRGDDTDVAAEVGAILADVRARGDAAVLDLTRRFDRWQPASAAALRLDETAIDAATAGLPDTLLAAIATAAARIERFHAAQLPRDLVLDDPAGLRLGMRWGPLDSVGLYVPGGKAAYPSSVLMNAIPARLAGVGRIVMCVPTPGGAPAPAVLAAARRAGVREVYAIGGAQAVGALAYGTPTIAPVDRIVGPGNAYVAEAKRQVFGRVGIDSIAGPSEVVVVADATNDPRHVALDLLAQAEHDEAAQAILITDDAGFAHAVVAMVAAELVRLPRAAIAGASWTAHGAVLLVRDWGEAIRLVNRLAPEHLQLMLPDAGSWLLQVRHAGAVFLGRYCPEALGDYVAGPNHVLPTGGSARFSSGLSVFDFLKRTTWVDATPAGLAAIGPAAVTLAEAEGLQAHAASVALRLG